MSEIFLLIFSPRCVCIFLCDVVSLWSDPQFPWQTTFTRTNTKWKNVSLSHIVVTNRPFSTRRERCRVHVWPRGIIHFSYRFYGQVSPVCNIHDHAQHEIYCLQMFCLCGLLLVVCFFFIGGTKNVDAPEIIYIYLGMNIDSNCIFQDAYKRCSCLFMYHECVTNFMCSKNDDIRVRYQSPSLWMFSSHVDHICHLHLTPQMRVSIDKAFPSLV